MDQNIVTVVGIYAVVTKMICGLLINLVFLYFVIKYEIQETERAMSQCMCHYHYTNTRIWI